MNLRVNLLYDQERRDCSLVTPRFIIGLTGVLLFVAVAAICGGLWISIKRHTLALNAEQLAWDRRQDEYKLAQTLAERHQAAEVFYTDLQAWREVRVDWGEQLSALAAVVPTTLQLSELKMTRSTVIPIAPEPKPVKGRAKPPPPPVLHPQITTEMRLIGKTSSPFADADVARLRDAFVLSPFSNVVSTAIIPPGAFRQDPAPRAGPADRIFEIVCTYYQKTL